LKKSYLKRKKGLNRHSEKGKIEAMTRQEVWWELVQQSNGKCAKCGKFPDFRGLQMHHVIPSGKGGKTDTNNCQLWCGRCHAEVHGTREV
jgi:5-methylcytosine-specific restriction endonuclease McrA